MFKASETRVDLVLGTVFFVKWLFLRSGISLSIHDIQHSFNIYMEIKHRNIEIYRKRKVLEKKH